MKKLILALFTLTLSLTSLFANEAAVKKAITHSVKLVADGKVMETIDCYTKDFVDINLDTKEKMDYNDSILVAKSISGKYPEEFLIVTYEMGNGKKPDAQELKKLREIAKTAEFQKSYSDICKQMIEMSKKVSSLELKTMKFISVKVKENNAVAVIEFETYDGADANLKTVIRMTETFKLRKVNGAWKICESASKKISR